MHNELPVSYKTDMPKRLRELLKKGEHATPASSEQRPGTHKSAHHVDQCTICAGVFDGISTRLADAAGFECLYLAGSGTSGSAIGEADLSVITATELADAARMMAGISSVPIIADADTGFGGPLNVARTIALYEAAGVAGCHIEDQTFRMSHVLLYIHSVAMAGLTCVLDSQALRSTHRKGRRRHGDIP